MQPHPGSRNQEPRAAAPGSWPRLLPGLLVLLCVAFLACQQTLKQNETTTSVRPTIEAVGPKGDTRWPFAFEWKATGATGAVYRVTVFDMVERPLVEQETRETRLDAPRDLEILLARTRRFQWRVTFVDGNGEPVAQSPLTQFTVR